MTRTFLLILGCVAALSCVGCNGQAAKKVKFWEEHDLGKATHLVGLKLAAKWSKPLQVHIGSLERMSLDKHDLAKLHNALTRLPKSSTKLLGAKEFPKEFFGPPVVSLPWLYRFYSGSRPIGPWLYHRTTFVNPKVKGKEEMWAISVEGKQIKVDAYDTDAFFIAGKLWKNASAIKVPSYDALLSLLKLGPDPSKKETPP